jgi:hypothetical protein
MNRGKPSCSFLVHVIACTSSNRRPFKLAAKSSQFCSRVCLLLADGGGQGDGLGAAKDLLVGGSAVAGVVLGGAAELLAAVAGAQGVLGVGKGVAKLGAELVVGVVGVAGEAVAEEQGLVKSLGLGDLDSRARGAELLGEGLARLDGGEGASAAAVGEGLDVDGDGAVVLDDGVLGGGEAEHGGGGNNGDLHDDGWWWFVVVKR